MLFLIRWITSTLIIMAAAYLLPGIFVDGFVTALATALLLGLVNAVIRPIVILLTLPITIVTLGLFALVINALLVLLVDWAVPGFEVAGFWWAAALSAMISIVTYAFKRS